MRQLDKLVQAVQSDLPATTFIASKAYNAWARRLKHIKVAAKESRNSLQTVIVVSRPRSGLFAQTHLATSGLGPAATQRTVKPNLAL